MNGKGNYHTWVEKSFNRPDDYPLRQAPPADRYRPVARWLGRLILPLRSERDTVRGAKFEVHLADRDHQDLIGQTVYLRWADTPEVQSRVAAATYDVRFSDKALKNVARGNVHAERVDGWPRVDPLESLAGAHPSDDVIVVLRGPVHVMRGVDGQPTVLSILREPVQVTGRYYGLVTFVGPEPGQTDGYWVRHFDPASRRFDGRVETVRLPAVLPNSEGIYPAVAEGIERSPLNSGGWYIFGALDHAGMFVVQALAPRDLLRVQPQRVITNSREAELYVDKQMWRGDEVPKGHVTSVLIQPHGPASPDDWRVGDQALVIHTFAGIGGRQRETATKSLIYAGHFAYGVAEVVEEPLAAEKVFNIVYYQVYTHNVDGLPAGVTHWSRYAGDRQFGWLGCRPLSDILLKLDPFTAPVETAVGRASALAVLEQALEIMVARYRVGDGTGGTYVGPANNCCQDSNQALYLALRDITQQAAHPPDQARRETLRGLVDDLQVVMVPFGRVRADWEKPMTLVGSNAETGLTRTLTASLQSWRTVFPRQATRRVAQVFMRHGAAAWVLQARQVGGYDPDIEPYMINTL